MFHSLALGYRKLLSLILLFGPILIRFWLAALVEPWTLSNISVRLLFRFSAFQTSIRRTSAAIWLIENHPSLASIFFTAFLSTPDLHDETGPNSYFFNHLLSRAVLQKKLCQLIVDQHEARNKYKKTRVNWSLNYAPFRATKQTTNCLIPKVIFLVCADLLWNSLVEHVLPEQ